MCVCVCVCLCVKYFRKKKFKTAQMTSFTLLLFSNKMQTLKYLQNFITIGDDMTLFQCIHCFQCLANKVSIPVTFQTVLGFTIWAPPFNKNKLTWKISCNQKALIIFRHDDPNSHVPGVNLLDFFVNCLSARNHDVKAINTVSAENSLDLISSNSLILGLVADNSWVEIKYQFENV